MFKKIKEFFVGKPVEVTPTPVETAPYKVPEPAAITPIPFVVTNSNPVDNVPVAAVETVPTALAVVNTAEGSAVIAAVPEKKARKPRTPKVETSVVEKAPAKAKAPKLTVVKAEKKAKSKKA